MALAPMRIRIKKIDGGIGTSLWSLADTYGLEKIPVWKYNKTKPEMVHELHRKFILAGSQIILANTFGANRIAVNREEGFSVQETVRSAMDIAKDAAKDTETKVFAAAGPLPVLLEPFGDLSADTCEEIYTEMFKAAKEGNADGILIQTFIDLAMMEVAVKAAMKFDLPVFASMTFEKVGKTMFGNSVKQVIDRLTPLGISAIGMNCTLTPGTAGDVLKQFRETDLPVLFKPNAGKPILSADGREAAAESAELFVEEILPLLEYTDYVGGCCGADWTYIDLLRRKMNA